MIRDIWDFPDRRIGRRVFVYSQTDSTNNRAIEHAGQPGLAFLADEQTAGRGQHGRTWVGLPGAGVLLSVLLAPPPALARPALLTAWAAVSVCETVRRLTGLPPRIKWPNDVLLHGRKIAGILIERTQRGPECEVVAGIGVNVRQSGQELSEAGLPEATSLRMAGANVETEAVARLLLTILEEEHQRLLSGEVAALEARWKRYLGLLGRSVRIDCADGPHQGRLLEVGFDGVVLEQKGEVRVITPESVRHLVEQAE